MTFKSLLAGIQISSLVLIAPLSVQEAKAQQWAYNMAAEECRLLRGGMSKDKTTQAVYQKYPEYHRYIDEYGSAAWVRELSEQCPEVAGFSTSSGSGGGNGCGISVQQMEQFRRTRRLVVNC